MVHFFGLNERQCLKEFIHSAKTARENDKGFGILDKHGFARAEPKMATAGGICESASKPSTNSLMIRKTRQGSVTVKSKCIARSRACSSSLTRSDGIGSVGLIRGCVGRCSKRSSSVTCPLFLPGRKRDPAFPFLRLLLRLIFSIPFLYNVQPPLENYCAEGRQRSEYRV